MLKKKASKMNVNAEKTMVGLRDLRTNLADYMDQVINKKQLIQVGKKFRPYESATIIRTNLLQILVEGVRFKSKVYFDEPTNQFVATVEMFNGDGVGDTKKEAIDMALDNIEALVDDYFENLDYYLKYPKFKNQLPYYLRLKLSESRDHMREILNLK